jgi:hypothetical protein
VTLEARLTARGRPGGPSLPSRARRGEDTAPYRDGGGFVTALLTTQSIFAVEETLKPIPRRWSRTRSAKLIGPIRTTPALNSRFVTGYEVVSVMVSPGFTGESQNAKLPPAAKERFVVSCRTNKLEWKNDAVPPFESVNRAAPFVSQPANASMAPAPRGRVVTKITTATTPNAARSASNMRRRVIYGTGGALVMTSLVAFRSTSGLDWSRRACTRRCRTLTPRPPTSRYSTCACHGVFGGAGEI